MVGVLGDSVCLLGGSWVFCLLGVRGVGGFLFVGWLAFGFCLFGFVLLMLFSFFQKINAFYCFPFSFGFFYYPVSFYLFKCLSSKIPIHLPSSCSIFEATIFSKIVCDALFVSDYS